MRTRHCVLARNLRVHGQWRMDVCTLNFIPIHIQKVLLACELKKQNIFFNIEYCLLFLEEDDIGDFLAWNTEANEFWHSVFQQRSSLV